MNPVDALDVTLSSGRRIPQVFKDSQDQIQVYDPPSRPCPGCGEVTVAGEEITKVYYAWWHAACMRGWLAEAGTDEAWKVIARQVAAHPSRFKTGEIRTVMEQLLRMAERDLADVVNL